MDFEDEAVRELMSNMWGNRSVMGRTFEKSGHGEMFVLRELMVKGGRTPSQLAAAMNVTSGRVSTVLAALYKKGLITRTADPKDRRSVLIGLSDEGCAHILEHSELMKADMRWIFSQMGERRTREFVDLVGEFMTYMKLVKPGSGHHPTSEEVAEAFRERDERVARLREDLDSQGVDEHGDPVAAGSPEAVVGPPMGAPWLP
ncbi:MAG: MarR family transcriptional regulator [Bifidobacterium sp.]|nr:MarR family transcriptional regulator [Bifidobacterium sp.]